MFNTTVLPLSTDDIPYYYPDEWPVKLLCCEEEVLAPLHNLEVKKASRTDGISAHMLKATANNITPGMTQLFNISIKLAGIPNFWKDAPVTLIPKEGDPTEPKNYRPISLLSILSKSFLSAISMLLLLATLTIHVLFRTVSGTLLLEDQQLMPL